MQYNQPLDQPSIPNASYIDGNPAAGINGSIVPAASIEFDQREVVEVITRANARGYSDFSGTPCASPANADLTQLRKAIEGFITSFQLIIDTEITFHVHGAGADFADLNAAMSYLRKYFITPRGHVILQCAGAVPGATTAVVYTYNTAIHFTHPNNNRISVYGAPMLAIVPRSDTAYASHGPSVGSRNTDIATNLAMLRTKFATEIHFVGGAGGGDPSNILGAGMIIGTSVPTLMNLDGFLLTTDGSTGCGVGWIASYGWMNQTSSMGLAAVGFPSAGFFFELGCAIAIEGPGNSDTTLTPLISIGSGQYGVGIGDGSYLTMWGNVISMNGGGIGFLVWPRCGCQMDGAVHSQSNAAEGIATYVGGASYIYGSINNGVGYSTSHIWKNGTYGIWAFTGVVQCYGDLGGGTGNANTLGSVYAAYGANVHGTAGDSGWSAGGCTPPFNTTGNGNAWVG